MFVAKRHIPRRTVLRGAGVTLALPLLARLQSRQGSSGETLPANLHMNLCFILSATAVVPDSDPNRHTLFRGDNCSRRGKQRQLRLWPVGGGENVDRRVARFPLQLDLAAVRKTEISHRPCGGVSCRSGQ